MCLALTPQNNDAFFREVDDEVRRERMERTARRYGVLVGAVVVLALAALAAVLIWRSHRETVAGERGEQFVAALSGVSSDKSAEARKKLDDLAATGAKGYAPLARVTLADMLIRDGKDKEAAAAFLAIAADEAAPRELRDMALVRATALDFDSVSPQAVIDRLKPLAIPGNPWFGSAGEMSALAYLKLNQKQPAGALLVQVAKDGTVPRTIKARTAQLAADLGFDVVQPADSAQS